MNLTLQVREIADVTTAVAEGDLGKKIQRTAQGEILQLQQTVRLRFPRSMTNALISAI